MKTTDLLKFRSLRNGSAIKKIFSFNGIIPLKYLK